MVLPENMPVVKLSISLAPEVEQALAVLGARSGQSKSALIEVALRENPLVAKYIEIVRAEMHAEVFVVPRREFLEKAKARRAAEAERAFGPAFQREIRAGRVDAQDGRVHTTKELRKKLRL